MLTATSIEGRLLLPLSELLAAASVPDNIAELDRDTDSFLNSIYFVESSLQPVENGFLGTVVLVVLEEIVVAPFGDVAGLVIGGGGGVSVFEARVRLQRLPGGFRFQIGLYDLAVGLRISPTILRPLSPGTNEPEPKDAPLNIQLGTVSIAFGTDEPLSVSWTGSVSIPRCMIGESGVIISAGAIRWLTPQSDNLPSDTPPAFLGIYLDDVEVELCNLKLNGNPSLILDFAFIGRGGFSGRIDLQNLNLSGSLAGFTFTLKNFGLTLVQNSIAASNVEGRIELPFFEQPLDVAIGIALDGGFSLAVSSPGGLIVLRRDGAFELELESICLSIEKGLFMLALSGQITPLVGDPGLTWPSFRVQDLSIDSEGNVRLEGGWLDLREQYTLSLYGFQLEISKIGFGSTDDGRRWIGFSGGLKFVDGLTAGASVEGLRILWDPATNATALTLSGVGVEFEVPDAVYFKGAVSMAELPGGGVRFDGDITLSLPAIGFEAEAQLVIGYDRLNDYPFFAIYLGVELPAGIPIAQTGLGLYGVAGLFALQMEPDKGKRKPDGTLEFPDEAWYAIQPAPSWFHRAPAPGDQPGVTNLRKWRNEKGSLALGAGVTIGTVADNGFTFAGRFLLGIIFPGPILFIEGRANLLKERASLRSEPLFRALAVLDARAGSFLVGLDAQYKVDDSGALIEIGGGAEAFFDFHNPLAWHLYLGIDEPRERRIRAEIIQRIFEANAYFMLDAQRLKTGAWVGYDKDWKFGPLKIALEAWIEGGANLSWKPIYLSGYLWLHGRIAARAFGCGFDLGADARFDAGVFDPFFVRAELSVSVDLPWPLSDAEAQIVLEWGPEKDPPFLPVPLKEVSIDHLKVTTSWPLRSTTPGALPWPDPGLAPDGFFSGNVPAAPSNTTPPPDDAPVVPLDARPRLTFGRPVNDDALVGVNPSTGLSSGPGDPGWERIGDPEKNQGPARVRSALKEIALEQWTGTQWQVTARTNPGGLAEIWGSWAPIPQLPSGTPAPDSRGPTANVKLWLWSRSPYDYTRRTGGGWEEWFSAAYPNYPCIDLPPDREVCCDFERLPIGPAPEAPWTCPDHPELVIGWRIPPIPRVVSIRGGKALSFERKDEAVVLFAKSVKLVKLFFAAVSDKETSECVDVSKHKKSDGTNPRTLDGFAFSVFDKRGQVLPTVVVKTWDTRAGSLGGVDAGWRTVVNLHAPADAVEVTLTAFGQPAQLAAFDDANRRVAETRMTGGQGTPETVRIEATSGGSRISFIEVIAPSSELAIHRVCRIETPFGSLVATASDRRGRKIGQFFPKDGVIEIPGRDVSNIAITSRGKPFCLKQVCWVVGLSSAERRFRQEMLRHVESETARWHEEGIVLRPYSQYRLKVTTTVDVRDFPYDDSFNANHQIIQCAHFRTEGPPGLSNLSVPNGHPLKGAPAPHGPSDAPAFESGVEDLTRYVKQTIPPTVAPALEPPKLPRPVYRAYDVGVQFNEDYVEQMYRAAGRDLGLYLYDANGRPARDSRGRLLTPLNRWGRLPTLELSASDERWLAQLEGANCHLRVDRNTIPRDVTVASEGQVLDPGTLLEGRLVPLLAHDRFDRYSVGATAAGTGAILADGLNRWVVRDVGTDSAPSRWIVRESGSPAVRSLEQTSDVSLGPSARSEVFPGGTFLIRAASPDLDAAHPDQPDNWKDYRASVYVRSSDDDLIGLAVRFAGNSGYLVYLDQQLNRRRVVLLRNGSGTLLAESQGGYLSNGDYHLCVEVCGDRLRVHVDGIPAFDLTDAAFSEGSLALFAGADAGALFADFRVDDLHAAAPVVYRFAFATSQFADFQHHLLSFRDETWRTTLPDVSTIDAAVAAGIEPLAVPLPSVSESEARAFANLAQAALGTVALQPVGEVEVTRVAVVGHDRALIVRTGEPIDWSRIQLEILRAPDEPLRPTAPRDVRIARVGFAGIAVPNDESVTLLNLNSTSLTGYRIERRTIRSSASPDLPDGQVIFEADLTADITEGPLELTRLWLPSLVDLSELASVPVFAGSQPSWAASGGILKQMAFVGRVVQRNLPPVPLRALIAGGATEWTDYRFSVEFMAMRAGGVGVLVRYFDADNHYRIELDRLRNRTTLVRRQAGTETTLSSGPVSYTVGQSHQLIVEVDGSYISATLDGTKLFGLFDCGLRHGRVGFLTLGGPKAAFRNPTVDAICRRLGRWAIKDFGPALAPSNWLVTAGTLLQSVDSLTAVAGLPNEVGTVLLADHSEHSDVRIVCDLTVPVGGSSGLVFRWRSPADHYRIVVDSLSNEFQLVCVAGGVATTIHRSAHSRPAALIQVEAIGTRVRLWIDGILLSDLRDSTHSGGLSGPLAMRGTAAAWHRFSVAHAEPGWEPWFNFSEEPIRHAGACLTVFAGTEGDAHPLAGTGEQRFAGAAASVFQPTFPPRGIDLRVIDRNDKICHMSRFLPASAYVLPVAAKIVRAADGTGFAVLAPDGTGTSNIKAGQYRVRFTYRRDNTLHVPDALILSQSGDVTDETASLDVPWSLRG